MERDSRERRKGKRKRDEREKRKTNRTFLLTHTHRFFSVDIPSLLKTNIRSSAGRYKHVRVVNKT